MRIYIFWMFFFLLSLVIRRSQHCKCYTHHAFYTHIHKSVEVPLKQHYIPKTNTGIIPVFVVETAYLAFDSLGKFCKTLAFLTSSELGNFRRLNAVKSVSVVSFAWLLLFFFVCVQPKLPKSPITLTLWCKHTVPLHSAFWRKHCICVRSIKVFFLFGGTDNSIEI